MESTFDVVIYGQHVSSWTAALGSAGDVWRLLPSVRSAKIVAADPQALLDTLSDREATVVIPLMEGHILKCPPGLLSLIPETKTVNILANKRNFSEYIHANQLHDLCPRTYTNVDVQFPCVLKRLELHAGVGIAAVSSLEALEALVGQSPWAGNPYLLQEYVPSAFDYVTNIIFRDGDILWHCSYQFDVNTDNYIRGPANTRGRKSVTASADTLAELSRCLAPLRYSGPINIDYRFDPQGRLKIFEANPRLGGTLMDPANIADLAAALSTIILNARILPGES